MPTPEQWAEYERLQLAHRAAKEAGGDTEASHRALTDYSLANGFVNDPPADLLGDAVDESREYEADADGFLWVSESLYPFIGEANRSHLVLTDTTTKSGRTVKRWINPKRGAATPPKASGPATPSDPPAETPGATPPAESQAALFLAQKSDPSKAAYAKVVALSDEEMAIWGSLQDARDRARKAATPEESQRAAIELANVMVSHGKATEAVQAAREGIAAERRLDLMSALRAAGGGKKLEERESVGTAWTSEEHKKRSAAHVFLSDCLSSDHPYIPPAQYDRPRETRGRAFYRGNLVHVARSDDAGTYVHELGHHLEANIPGAREACQEFLKKRVGDEQPTNLREKFGKAYWSGETGRRDTFDKVFGESVAYYVGKQYSSGETEVLSMGLQQLHRDPDKLARYDPEYFDLMVSILQNQHRSPKNA